MLEKFLHLSLARKAASITAAISFFACTILVLASDQNNRQLIFQSAEMLGDSLAQQLAQDAGNSLVQGDKLSLQSVLNTLVKNGVVAHAAVYDVENMPVAEAGNSRKKTSQSAFSASINFQDSLAGYAVISIDISPLQKEANILLWQLFALSILISLLSYLLGLIPARYLSAAINDLTTLVNMPQKHTLTNIQLGYRGYDEFQQLTQRVIDGPEKAEEKTPDLKADNRHDGDHTVIFLDIKNLKTLKEQRNQQDVTKLVAHWHRQVSTICQLYDGEVSVNSSHGFSAKFLVNHGYDHPFRALCAAYLIEKQLTSTLSKADQNPMQVHLGIAICEKAIENPEQNPIDYQLSLHHTVETAQQLCRLSITENSYGRIYTSTLLLQHLSIQNRVSATTIDATSAVITKLEDHYSALLDKQRATLAIGT